MTTAMELAQSIELGTARQRANRAIREVLHRAFRPPVRMGLTEWADTYRYLSPESSAEAGKYVSERAHYQRGPMEALSDPAVRRVVLMWPSQVGKTEVLNNFIGKRIHLEPGPMLVMQPTKEMAEAWSKDRLAPMLRDSPALRGLVKDARSRDADNTILHKKFPGGHVTVVGARSAAGLASRPIRDICCDEVDRYSTEVGDEGDPIGLAFRRGTTFARYGGKQLLISSPTVKGRSRIAADYEDGTRERRFVPCPHCHTLQILRWGGRDTPFGIKWEPGKPETAHYVCESCHCEIAEMWKGWMDEHGVWVAENPDHPTTRSFWTNALISPWAPWSDLVREFLAVKSDRLRFKQFVNTVLCELWVEEEYELDAHHLLDKLEVYPCRCSAEDRADEDHARRCDSPLVPAGVGVLVQSVDVQGDRLERCVWGFGVGEEAWLVDHEIIPGDPGTPAPWKELADKILTRYPYEGGGELKPEVTFVDSGGHHTKEVYAFCRTRVRQKVYAIKGSSEQEGVPLLGRASRNNAAKAILYPVGSFTGKEAALSMLMVKEPGPKYVHLPAWLDNEQLQQFTNEAIAERMVGGRKRRIWVKKGRNEMLDLFVYALAALQQLGPARMRRIIKAAQERAVRGVPQVEDAVPEPAAQERPKARRRRRASNYVNSW